MVDRSSFEPLYQQIKRDIEEQILDGRIKVGDKLMSETEMLNHYHCGRTTIRNALSELVLSGCLRKEQGFGTFCAALPKRDVPKNIHVLLNTADTYFIPYLLSGISRVLNERNCSLILHDTLDFAEEHGEDNFGCHNTDAHLRSSIIGRNVTIVWRWMEKWIWVNLDASISSTGIRPAAVPERCRS